MEKSRDADSLGQSGNGNVEERLDGRSIRQILQDIVNHINDIIRSELRLAKTEVQENVRDFAKAGTWIGVALVLALYALGFLLLSAVYALQAVMASWLAALLVGIAVGTVAALLYLGGRKKLAQGNLKPDKTLQTLEDNVTWLKNQTK